MVGRGVQWRSERRRFFSVYVIDTSSGLVVIRSMG